MTAHTPATPVDDQQQRDGGFSRYQTLLVALLAFVQFTIILDPDPDEGGYTVTVPALPGVVTQGETIEEAIAMAREAVRCSLHGSVYEAEELIRSIFLPFECVVNFDQLTRRLKQLGATIGL